MTASWISVADLRSAAGPSPDPAAGPEAEALSVLIVDDEPQVVEHLCAGLELLGYVTRRAGSAEEALERLRGDASIGVVVTDIRMPGGDGLSLAHDILQDMRGGSPIQVVLITGHATLDDATAALRVGVTDMLRKPFRLAEAAAAVEKAMRAARAERAAARSRAAESARVATLERDRDDLSARLDQALARLGTLPGADAAAEHIRNEAHAISHALRTPLNAISGGAELIAYTGTSSLESNLQLLRGGVQQAVRAIELVEELYRTERPAAAQAPQRQSLARAAADAAARLSERVAEKALALKLPEPDPAVEVTLASEPLRRVLMHALEAAIDWSTPGATITLATAQAHDNGIAQAVLTLDTTQPGQAAATAAAAPPPHAGSALSRTQEDLHFAIARKIAGGLGGQLTSWNQGVQAMTIRLALPA